MFDSLEFIYGPVLNLLSGFANWVNELGQDYWGLFMILGLYQLVAIKWRLIDRARNENVPKTFITGQRGLITKAAQPFQPRTNIPKIDNPPPAAPRADDAFFEQSAPGSRISSQAGLQSFVNRNMGRNDLNK